MGWVKYELGNGLSNEWVNSTHFNELSNEYYPFTQWVSINRYTKYKVNYCVKDSICEETIIYIIIIAFIYVSISVYISLSIIKALLLL